MKNGILVMMLQFIFFQFMIGQTPPPDYQWVIKEGEGVSRATNPISYNSIGTTYDYLEFQNFKHPADITVEVPRKTRNDIFVIYENGNFFNSYDLFETGSGVMWPQNRGLGSGYKLNITSISSPIKYLYWTNRYEGDDLDNSVRVVSGSGVSSLSDFPRSIEPYINTDYFNVNHDIVGNKDITVIIKRADFNCFYYTLHFNECTAPTPNCLGLLGPGNVKSSTEPNFKILTPIDFSQNSIQLEFNSLGIAYVNFRVKDNVVQEMLDNLKAKFRLTKVSKNKEGCSGNINDLPDPFEVQILAAHDPNFIKLDSICEIGNGTDKDYFLHYYVQVQNTGNLGTAPVKIVFPLPDVCDENAVKLKRIIYNGLEQDLSTFNFSSEVNTDKELIITFPITPDLNAFTPSAEFTSVAGFAFCVKVNETSEPLGESDSKFEGLNLIPVGAQSFFDGNPYDINTFMDIFKRLLTRSCDCGNGIQVPYTVDDNNLNPCPLYYLFCNGIINWVAVFGYGLILFGSIYLVTSRRR
jgi:hypothetical protein